MSNVTVRIIKYEVAVSKCKQKLCTYPRCSRVLIANPSVGEIVSISSPLNFFTIVVFPALSNPLTYYVKHTKQSCLPRQLFKMYIQVKSSSI